MITKNGCFHGGDGPYESQTAGVLYNKKERENVLTQVNRFVSHSSSHTLSNVHCITYSEHRCNRALSCRSGGYSEEAENNKKF